MLGSARTWLRFKTSHFVRSTCKRAYLSTSRSSYPNFRVTSTIEEFRSNWSYLSAGTKKNESDGDIVYLAGRVVAKRDASNSLSFIDISDGNVYSLPENRKLQVMAQKQILEEGSTPPQEISRGDIIGIKGFPGKSKTAS